LVRRPSVLVLYEPTNGLDLEAEDATLRFLADLNRRERETLLFVTHNITIAARYATHVALFHAGKVVSGPRQELLQGSALAQVYGVKVEITAGPSGAVALRVCPQEEHP
jgi:iron complex transport system ATP-binding protein